MYEAWLTDLLYVSLQVLSIVLCLRPEQSPPNKQIKYNKILTNILRLIFLEIPYLELPRWWKTPRDTNGKGV